MSSAQSAAESEAGNIEFRPSEDLSEKYIDLDNMSFWYDGKVYTLGKTTLKELIDDGVSFDEVTLHLKDKTVDPNETGLFFVDFNDGDLLDSTNEDGGRMICEFLNTGDSAKKAEDCVLCRVSWETLTVPNYSLGDAAKEENDKKAKAIEDAENTSSSHSLSPSNRISCSKTAATPTMSARTRLRMI